MNDYTTVWFNGQVLLLNNEVASENNLKENDVVTDIDVFWQLIRENASMGLAKIYIEKAKNSVEDKS